MTTRRAFILSAAALPLTRAFADDQIKADMLPGKPPILDFGGGLRVPMDHQAFLTLWENDRIWLTYGAGSSNYAMKAMGDAQTSAIGTMKLLLLTLAFAPARLEHVDNCGWRLKTQNPKDYVMGDLALPGRPFRPVFTSGSGNGRDFSAGNGDNTGGFTRMHAFTGYIVMKRDVSLAVVRARAQILG